jgi:FkbM family methyltransferase
LSRIKNIAKSCALFALGHEKKPRTILRGLASGFTIAVSPAENLSYLVGTYEPHLQRAIKKYVNQGDTVYDIGANIGYVALSLAKKVGPNGRVAAFEPVPRNIEALVENIENNQLTNIQVFNVAASDKQGLAVIRSVGNLSTASLIWHMRETSARKLTINTASIDELVVSGNLIGNPRFVKIDVEGAEGLVLLGMEQTIADAKPVIFVECSEAGRETTWRLLTKLNYRCRSAISDRPVTQFDEYRHSDFLWIPARPEQ